MSIIILIIICRAMLAYGMCPLHGESKCATSHTASQQSQRSRGASDLFPYLLRGSKLSWPTKGQGQVSGDWHLCNLHGHTAHTKLFSCRDSSLFADTELDLITSSGWPSAIKNAKGSMLSDRKGVVYLMKNTQISIDIFVIGD